MSLKRYEYIRRYLHAVDNTTKNEHSGKLFKVKPVLDAVRNNCIKIEQERDQSVDEQMIHAKTKRSGIRQYMQKKSTNVVLKILLEQESQDSYTTSLSMQVLLVLIVKVVVLKM